MGRHVNEWTFHTGARGLDLAICEWPGERGLPLVILHGFLEQGACWHEVATRLSRRCIAPDQRGFGGSEHVGRGGWYHFWDYISDLDALVQHLGGKVDLVGHSMGGTVSAMYAGLRPDAVRRLVLIEGLGPPDMRATLVDRGRAFLDHRARHPKHPTFPSVEAAAARMRRWHPQLTEATSVRLAARVVREVEPDDPEVREREHPLTWRWDPLHRARSPQPFQADLFSEHLARITAPTLLVDGADSVLVLQDRAARQARIRGARRIVLDNAGHMVHFDRPEALAGIIEEHLRGA